MTPLEYLRTVVLPTVREFLERPGDARRAYLSAIVAYHVIDYVMQTTPPPADTSRRKRKEWQTECRERLEKVIAVVYPDEFAVVEGMCHGSKHCGRDKPDTLHFRPGDEQIARPFGFAEAGDCAPFGQGHFGPPRLIVHHNGRDILVDEAVVRFLSVCQDAFREHLECSEVEGLIVQPY